MNDKTIRKIDQLHNWEQNPRSINNDDFARLKRQIQKLGVYKPLLITDDGTVLGGNMRLRAYKELGIADVWVSVVDAPDDTKKLEYALSDNDRAGTYDEQMLAELITNTPDIELGDYKVDLGVPIDLTALLAKFGPVGTDSPEYTDKIDTPVYTPSDIPVTLEELVDESRVKELLSRIERAPIPEGDKAFLKLAAFRHYKFTYSKIADYYASAPTDVQTLMEESALVIIDFNKAIQQGYVEMNDELKDLYRGDHGT